MTTAFAELVADGVIEVKRGSGTRVLNNTWTLLAAASPPDWYAYVQAGIHQPNLATIQEINRAETWEVPSGGFYIWLRLLVPVSLPKLFEEALRQGILLNTGNIYDPDEREHIRLSYAYASYSELEEGIYRLSLLLQKKSKETRG